MPAPFLSDKALRIYCPKSSVPINAPIITINKAGKLEEIKKGDVVYISGNEKHALKNNGKETLKFYWIFPTDRFSEVEYFN